MFSFWGRQYDSSGYIEGVRKNRVSGLTGTGLYEMMRNLLDKDGCLQGKKDCHKKPEFCKELGKKSSEHRMNTGVQSFFEMHRSVVFFTHF